MAEAIWDIDEWSSERKDKPSAHTFGKCHIYVPGGRAELKQRIDPRGKKIIRRENTFLEAMDKIASFQKLGGAMSSVSSAKS